MAALERNDETVKPRRGVSLAKGPVALIGVASLVFGVLGFLLADANFDFNVPDGTVTGSTFLGIEGNGWTWTLFAAAGLLLLLGSPVHWGAKSMAFIVGVAMIVGALISLADGSDVLGLIATNDWTTLIMGAMGVALVVLALMPRIGQRRGSAPPAVRDDRELEPSGRFDRERTPAADTPHTEPTATTTGRGTLDDRR